MYCSSPAVMMCLAVCQTNMVTDDKQIDSKTAPTYHTNGVRDQMAAEIEPSQAPECRHG